MASENTQKIAVNLMLNNGTTPTGATKFATVALGKMSIAGYDADKCLAVASLVDQCLTKAVMEVRKVTTAQLTNS